MSGLVVCIEDHSGDTTDTYCYCIDTVPVLRTARETRLKPGLRLKHCCCTRYQNLFRLGLDCVLGVRQKLVSRLASRSSFLTPFNFVLAHNQRFSPSETEGERVFGTTLWVAYWQPVGLHLILVSFHSVWVLATFYIFIFYTINNNNNN